MTETVEYRGYQIKIEMDEDPCCDSPRDWDNLGVMVCFHSRYSLGDKHDFTTEEIKEFVERNDVISLPLYLYDHSGITMRTYPFDCPWDSGQVGFIYVTHEDVRKEFKVKKVGSRIHDRVLAVLCQEVTTYNQYLTNDIYGYQIEANGEHIDSCWGYYGHDFEQNDLLPQARSAIDLHIEQEKLDRAERIEAYR